MIRAVSTVSIISFLGRLWKVKLNRLKKSVGSFTRTRRLRRAGMVMSIVGRRTMPAIKVRWVII